MTTENDIISTGDISSAGRQKTRTRGRETLLLWGWSLLPPFLILLLFAWHMAQTGFDPQMVLRAMAVVGFVCALPVFLLAAFFAARLPGRYAFKGAGLLALSSAVVLFLVHSLTPPPLSPADVAKNQQALNKALAAENEKSAKEVAEKKARREKEIAALKEKAAAGDAAAQYETGQLYLNGKEVPRDDAEALSLLQKAAAQNYPPAEASLGQLYESGLGVSTDYARALDWLRKAAAQGDADAEFDLGWMYSAGEGVARDPAAASGWLLKAAARGKPEAQYAAGQLAENGGAAAPDDAQAYLWYSLASPSNPLAAEARDRVAARLSPGQLDDAKKRALAWKPSPP